MKETDILEKALSEAKKLVEKNKFNKFPDVIKINIDTLIGKIDSNKSPLSALVTSLVKKITTPGQDIRLHRTDFENGYSARSLDTKITAPFFKQHFPKYANKESAFLTLATREKIPWTKSEGQNLKIRDKNVKTSFIEVFDVVEKGKVKPKDCLQYIFAKLFVLSKQQYAIFDETIEAVNFDEIVNLTTVIRMLEAHFETKLSSRLPVIAIYTAYQELIKEVKRYSKKVLRPLNVHTSSDKHGFGDVEVWNNNNTPYEMVEIKHNIAIDLNLIFDIAKKSEKTTIERYYILTTYKNSFLSKEEEDYINKFILKLYKDSGLEIIANGIIPSLKYYLRFIEDYKGFLLAYTGNLIIDAKNSTEIKDFHIEKWKELLQEHKI